MKASIFGLGALALVAIASVTVAQERTKLAEPPAAGQAVATFAGGCFWCMEPPFDKLEGVVSTTSGYTGGTKPGATYREVSAEDTGHYEAVRVVYDPAKVSYEKLLDVFWHNHDPLDATGQFCDKGESYRPAVFFNDEAQKRLIEASKAAVAAQLKAPIATQVLPAADFWVAEDYHQNYYQTNALKYKYYRYACGRDARLEEIWGKPGA